MGSTRCACVVALSLVVTAGAADPAPKSWPQFRGPQGSGIAADKKPAPVQFGPGKNELWKTEMPPGLSSPCVWDDRIFLTGCDVAAKKCETLCLSRRDGRRLWSESVTVEKLENVHKTSSPATATPVCDGERVYVYFGSYGLIAYTLDGKPAWEMRLPVPSIMFGSGASPIIVGDVIVINRLQGSQFFGGPAARAGDPAAKSEILAVNRCDGTVAWRAKMTTSGFGRTHASPAIIPGGDGDLIAIASGSRVSALDAKTGKEVWRADTLAAVATATPVVAGDRLFLNCTGLAGDTDRVEPLPFDKALEKWDKDKDGKLQKAELPDELALFTRHRGDREGDFSVKQWFFNRADADRDGALDQKEWGRLFKEMADDFVERMKPGMFAVKLGGAGDVTRTHVAWGASRGVPEVPTLLVVGRHLYAVRNGGLLTCLDAESGKQLFEERLGATGIYYASPVSDGERIYFASQPGVITVVLAGDKFDRLARNDLGDDIGATPAIVDGELYVRTAKFLYAFGIGR